MKYYKCPNAGDRRCSNNYSFDHNGFCSLCGSPPTLHHGFYYCSSWVFDCDDKNIYTNDGPCECTCYREPIKEDELTDMERW